jgi:integrase
MAVTARTRPVAAGRQARRLMSHRKETGRWARQRPSARPSGPDRGLAVGLSGPPVGAEPGPGALFLSESRRNRAEPLSLWTWSKVVRRVALTAGVPQFSTHTMRHLCLTDLARMGWELHAIAAVAGHRSTDATLTYIHLSGRDLAGKLSRGMEQIQGWRVDLLARLGEQAAGAVRS